MPEPSEAAPWIVPGQRVVIIHGRNNDVSPVLTIERVLKRDVVLSNGDRWSQARADTDHLIKSGSSTWAPSSFLFPEDSPIVARYRREAGWRSTTSRIAQVVDRVEKAVRRADWDEARRLHAHLGDWLVNAPEPPAPSTPTGGPT